MATTDSFVDTGPEKGVRSLTTLIRQFEESALQQQRLKREAEQGQLDNGEAKRRQRGLEMANEWILSEAANHHATSLLEVSLKLKLWRMHIFGSGKADPLTPEQELVTSVHDDIANLMALEA